MSSSAKRTLAERLLKEAQQEENGTQEAHPNQDQDFENPFNIAPPTYISQVKNNFFYKFLNHFIF